MPAAKCNLSYSSAFSHAITQTVATAHFVIHLYIQMRLDHSRGARIVQGNKHALDKKSHLTQWHGWALIFSLREYLLDFIQIGIDSNCTHFFLYRSVKCSV